MAEINSTENSPLIELTHRLCKVAAQLAGVAPILNTMTDAGLNGAGDGDALFVIACMSEHLNEEVSSIASRLGFISTASDSPHTSNTTKPCLVQSANAFCVSMAAFFDLAEQEIKKHNTSDFDHTEFLVKGAKAEMHKFSNLVYDIEEAHESLLAVSHG